MFMTECTDKDSPHLRRVRALVVQGQDTVPPSSWFCLNRWSPAVLRVVLDNTTFLQ